MWLLNAANGEYEPIKGQGADEWYQHEFWSQDGARICFHGGLKGDKDVGFCGWYEPDTGKWKNSIIAHRGGCTPITICILMA